MWISRRETQCTAFVKLRTTKSFCFRCDGHQLFLLAQRSFPLSATDFCFHSGLKGLNLNLCHFPHQKSKQVIQGWPKRVLLGKSCWPYLWRSPLLSGLQTWQNQLTMGLKAEKYNMVRVFGSSHAWSHLFRRLRIGLCPKEQEKPLLVQRITYGTVVIHTSENVYDASSYKEHWPPTQNGFTNKKHRFFCPNRSPYRWLLDWWIQMLNVASRNWFIPFPPKMGVPLEVPLMPVPNLSKPQFPCFFRPKRQSYPWFPPPFLSRLPPTHR